MKCIDLIFSRYGSVETLLDGYISTGRFREFLGGFIDICNEEQAYDVWKHKVYGKSFSEFRSEISSASEPVKPVNVRDILRDSFEILNEFKPQEGVS